MIPGCLFAVLATSTYRMSYCHTFSAVVDPLVLQGRTMLSAEHELIMGSVGCRIRAQSL